MISEERRQQLVEAGKAKTGMKYTKSEKQRQKENAKVHHRNLKRVTLEGNVMVI